MRFEERREYCDWIVASLFVEQRRRAEWMRRGIATVFDGVECGILRGEELMRLVVPIIHKEREAWRKSDVLGLGVRAALELLRFFCVIPLETVTTLMKDILFVLASGKRRGK